MDVKSEVGVNINNELREYIIFLITENEKQKESTNNQQSQTKITVDDIGNKIIDLFSNKDSTDFKEQLFNYLDDVKTQLNDNMLFCKIISGMKEIYNTENSDIFNEYIVDNIFIEYSEYIEESIDKNKDDMFGNIIDTYSNEDSGKIFNFLKEKEIEINNIDIFLETIFYLKKDFEELGEDYKEIINIINDYENKKINQDLRDKSSVLKDVGECLINENRFMYCFE